MSGSDIRTEVNQELMKVFDENFIGLWWGLRLPGLGNARPIEVLETAPDTLLDYARGYSTTTSDVDAGGVEEINNEV